MEPVTVSDDPKKVVDVVSARTAEIIGVDGCALAGKTCLARRLAKLLDGLVVDADDFLNRGTGNFVTALRLNDLKAAIEAAHISSGLIFIASDCLLDVVKRIDVNLGLLIYVERRTPRDLPGDLPILDCEDGDESGLIGLSDLDREIGYYHRDFRPRTIADVIFLRHSSTGE